MDDRDLHERLSRVERRLEALEERVSDMLRAIAERWTTLSRASQTDAAAIALAAAKPRGKRRE